MIRARVVLVVGVVIASSVGGSPARAAASAIRPATGLSTPVDNSGTATLVSSVRTASIRAAVPAAARAPRILILGTGVQRSIFPTALQNLIRPLGAADATDPYGAGTLAASALLQLLPDAHVLVRRIPALDPNWDVLDMSALAAALEWAHANAASFDAVLFALPPQGALDPVSTLIGRADYGALGKGMTLVTEALLAARGPVAGIPADRALRDRIFAGANLRQRDAVERFARQTVAWRRVVRSVHALTGAGVAVVAPSGDYTRKQNGSAVPLPAQSVFGLAALPDVITVGAAYDNTRISPTSGRGPTLSLGLKPDLLAPSDIVGLLPAGARLPWPDDSTRALAPIDWARDDATPTPCPSVTNAYRCVLQGSTYIAAAVAAANIATLVANGVPHTADARTATDDEVLRGLAWAAADRIDAPVWEQGAGVVTGLRGIDPVRAVVPLARAQMRAPGWTRAASVRVPTWRAPAEDARASLSSFLGADVTGAQLVRALDTTDRVKTAATTDAVTVTAGARTAAGGLYAGWLAMGATEIPLILLQEAPLDFHVDYAYNEFQTAGREGERVERATVALFAGMPSNVGLIGNAFKNLSAEVWGDSGGDPLAGIAIRYATTRDSFTEAVPASHHGWGRIDAVPPGYYRMHLLSDHAMEAQQARGRVESLGIRYAAGGPEAVTVPGENLLVASAPPCGATATGPLGCVARDVTGAEVDAETGLCVARGETVAYNVYCGEIAFSVPTAFVSRAIHQIEFDRHEWATCGVDVPLDGTRLDFGSIVAKSAPCSGPTAPTSWSFEQGAPDCIGPAERARTPRGHPADVTVALSGPSADVGAARNLPVAVMTYEFALPHLNTYTTAGLALAYEAENAIVAVRFNAGRDDSNGVLVVDDPDVRITPDLHEAGARGAAYTEWSVMSANAPKGSLSLIVIPTAWGAGVDPREAIARVQLCTIALRVSTFAKRGWGAARDDIQTFPTLDRGLAAQTAGTRTRARSAFANGAFTDLGSESESLTYAIQVPKDTTQARVRSPRGGPASLRDVRIWGEDARAHASVMPANAQAHDPGYGITNVACSENAATPADAQTCRAWNTARAAGTVLAELAPAMYLNGRFAGTMAIDGATVRAAGGNVAFENATTAGDTRWSPQKRFGVSAFYDDALPPFSLSGLGGIIGIVADGAGKALQVRADSPAGVAYTITAPLR